MSGAWMDSFFKDPENFLRSLNLGNGTFDFIRTDRQTLSDLPFLDHRFLDKGKGGVEVTSPKAFQFYEDLESAANPGSVNYIFHTAFCGSTFLARLLDIKGKNFSLKEPMAFLSLAQFKVQQGENLNEAQWQALFRLTLVLLARPFEEAEKVLIKPSNSANGLLEDIFISRLSNKALLMFASLENFLVSILKDLSSKSRLVEQSFPLIAYLNRARLPLDESRLPILTTLQKAVLVWWLQMDQFKRVLEADENNRLASMDFQTLLQHPEETLRAVLRFFDIPVSPGVVERIVTGKSFSRNAKDDALSFNRNELENERQSVLQTARPKITEAMTFAAELNVDIFGGLPKPVAA